MRRFIAILFLIQVSIHAFAQGDYDFLIDKAKFHEAGSPDSILFYADKAISLDENKIEAAYWMGVGLRLKNQLDSALFWYQKYAEKASSPLQLGNASMGIGGIFYSKGAYIEALEAFSKSAELFKSIENERRLAASYVNIAIVVGLIGNEEKAKNYYLESIEILDRLKDKIKILPPLVNLAGIYQHQEQYDSSIYYAQWCYDISDSLDLKFGKARALFVLSPSHIRSGKSKTGYEMAITGRELFESMGVLSTATLMKCFEAEALFEMGQVEEALAICQGLESDEFGFPEQLYGLMNKIYEKKGDYQQSLLYHRKFHNAYEEYEKKLKAEQVNRLEAQYESERKENDILRLQNEIAIQQANASRKNWIIGSMIGMSLLLFISLLFHYQKRIAQEKEQSAIHKQQLLRSQINPHFIFNSLSSIRGFLFSGGDTKPAITYLGRFAKLMRMILELSSKEWVTLEEEVKALELYLSIQQIRFNKAFDFNFSIDPSLDTSDIIVPPLTAQPFIENAIEHGLKGMDKDGKVEISCLKKQGKLIFKIQDNGIGIDHVEPTKNHQSRAMQIFRERLAIIGKRMKMSFAFNISDIGNEEGIQGTLVIYELPLIKA